MAFSKKLPANRADYTIGDLVYWHVLVYGTRPKGNPSAKVGRPWDLDSLAHLLGLEERTLRNWMSGKTRPTKLGLLADELFGNNELFDEWRLELLGAYRKYLLDDSQAISARSETLEAEGPNSQGTHVEPSGPSDLSVSNGGGAENPPNEYANIADANLAAQGNDASALADSGEDHIEASRFSNAPDETVGHPAAADAGSEKIEKGEPLADNPRNDSTQSRNEETPVRTKNPIILSQNSPAGSGDRYFRYRKRAAIVGVGLTVVLGFYAWISAPPAKPGKASETAPSAPAPNPPPAPTPQAASPSRTAVPLPNQSATAPPEPAAPTTSAPSTTLNSPPAVTSAPPPTPPETKPGRPPMPPTVVPSAAQKPAEPVPAAPTFNEPAATHSPSAPPPIPSEPKPTHLPGTSSAPPQATQEPAPILPSAPAIDFSAPTRQPSAPATPLITSPPAASQPSTKSTPSAEAPKAKQDDEAKAAEQVAREKEKLAAATKERERRECIAGAQQTFRTTITKLLPTLTSKIDYQESAARYFIRRPPKAFALCINWERSTPTKWAGDGFGFATLDSGDSPRISTSQALASCIRSNGGSEGAKCCVIVDRDGQTLLTFPPEWPSSCN
jgi:hypothetical protein